MNITYKNEKSNGVAVRLSQDGKYLYVSLREENAICVYRTRGDDIEFLPKTDCEGDGPRDFCMFGDVLVCCNVKVETFLPDEREDLVLDKVENLRR